jgi:hypothetical protein
VSTKKKKGGGEEQKGIRSKNTKGRKIRNREPKTGYSNIK